MSDLVPIRVSIHLLRLARKPSYGDLALQHDDQKVKDYGVNLAVEMIRKLTADGDIRGVHFCTLNLERSVTRVLERLQWVGGNHEVANKLIAVSH